MMTRILEEMLKTARDMKDHALAAAVAAYNAVEKALNLVDGLLGELFAIYADIGPLAIYALRTIQAQEAIEIITTAYMAVLAYKVARAKAHSE